LNYREMDSNNGADQTPDISIAAPTFRGSRSRIRLCERGQEYSKNAESRTAPARSGLPQNRVE